MSELAKRIETRLMAGAKDPGALKEVLGWVLANFRSETGTIHSLDIEKQLLHLVADIGVPPPVLEVVRLIPVGKGIAGQVVARGGPVTICNIQTDTSGVAKAGAKGTGVGGALCVPLRRGETIVGTIGVGTSREYEYTPEETRSLEAIGRQIGAKI